MPSFLSPFSLSCDLHVPLIPKGYLFYVTHTLNTLTIHDRAVHVKAHSGTFVRVEELLGVAVAVNRPVRVGLDAELEPEPEFAAVAVTPGQLLSDGYHTPLMTTPSPLSKLRTASDGQELAMARM